MSGHTYTHTHIHTYTQDNYSNPAAHARRGLIIKHYIILSISRFLVVVNYDLFLAVLESMGDQLHSVCH